MILADERSFHVFYQLLAGASTELRNRCHLEGGAAAFALLKVYMHKTCVEVWCWCDLLSFLEFFNISLSASISSILPFLFIFLPLSHIHMG